VADLIPSSITSYKCRGFNHSKINYIRTLLPKAFVVFLQEHWLSKGQLCTLGDINGNYLLNAVSGSDSSEVLSVRPFGGCAILWRSDMNADVKIIDTSSRRMCAIKMITAQVRLLFINVYAL